MQELPQQLGDERRCADFLIQLRWPAGFICPTCGNRRAALLASRADTFECRDCRRQTSITAGTIMQDTKLTLRKWLRAARIYTDSAGTVSAAHLSRLLEVDRHTAGSLKRKLKQSADKSLLEGPVAIDDREIGLRSGRLCTLAVVREQNSRHFRASVLPDKSFSAVEEFLSSNVAPGATLLVHKRSRYETVVNYKLASIESEMSVSIQEAFRFINDMVCTSATYALGELDRLVRHYAYELNNGFGSRQISFETLVKAIMTERPTSYWDFIDRENPRRGNPTDRRSPRRRKTAYGMRQDGSEMAPSTGSTPEL
jgi:hypothetical protein